MQGTTVVFVHEESLCKINFYSLSNCLFIEHNFCFHHNMLKCFKKKSVNPLGNSEWLLSD